MLLWSTPVQSLGSTAQIPNLRPGSRSCQPWHWLAGFLRWNRSMPLPPSSLMLLQPASYSLDVQLPVAQGHLVLTCLFHPPATSSF